MAKNVIICALFVGLIALAIYSVFKASESTDQGRRVVLAEKTIKRAKEDSVRAMRALFDVRDSLETMTTIAMNFKIDANKAIHRANQITKQHEDFIFHNLTPTKRDSLLKSLYPSYRKVD